MGAGGNGRPETGKTGGGGNWETGQLRKGRSGKELLKARI